jgi:hypothetical protein
MKEGFGKKPKENGKETSRQKRIKK